MIIDPREDWKTSFRAICEHKIDRGENDEQIMNGVLQAKREQCRQLLAQIRAERKNGSAA